MSRAASCPGLPGTEVPRMWESPIETRTVGHSSRGPSGVPWPSRPPGLRETYSGRGAELGAAAGRQGPGFTEEKGSSGSFRLYISAVRHRATSRGQSPQAGAQ